MAKLIHSIQDDLGFIRAHTLQPKWFKILKVFILVGFLAGYALLFSFSRMVVFAIVFFGLSALVHYTYRYKTHRWQQSWLDFVVYRENGSLRYQRIGKFYYGAVITNLIIAIAISQGMAK
jgi:hypothetical protein